MQLVQPVQALVQALVQAPVQALLVDWVIAPAKDPYIVDEGGMVAGTVEENSSGQVRRMVALETCKENLCKAS